MSAELVAILCLFAFLVVVIIVGVVLVRREEAKWSGTIDNLKVELEQKVHDNLQAAIDAFGGSFQEILGQPTIKKAFALIGSQGGEAKAQNGLVDEIATDILESPALSAARMGAEALGLDVEGYIEKHGALKTISAIQQFAKIAGIDLMKFDLSSLSLPGKHGGGALGDNPYFRR